MTTSWSDWTAAVAQAYADLAERADRIVVAGLSMGGALALWTGLEHPEVPGSSASTRRRSRRRPEVRAMLEEMLAAGTEVIPGIGSDIADPDAHEIAYEGTPLRPLLSLIDDGLAPLSTRYGELHMPLLLFTSRQDHTVEPSQSEYLAAHYGGPVDHRWLERSYHVATQDFDRDAIFLATDRVRAQGHRFNVSSIGLLHASALPADIPSPSSGTLTIGPLSLNAYGLMIALGVIAAVWLFGRRLEQKGIGTRDDANAIAIWAVLAGVIGARLYHVITDWERFEGSYGDIIKIWEGGLGIPGGMLLGVLVGVYFIRRRGIPLGPAVNAAAPALPLAQAIGRWGNYFNQELFGSPTDLPWALEVDDRDGARRRLPAGDDVPSDVPLRVAVQLRAVRTPALDRQALQPGRWPALRHVRARLRHHPLLGRRSAHRSGRRARRSALEPVGRAGMRRRRRAVPDRARATSPRTSSCRPVPELPLRRPRRMSSSRARRGRADRGRRRHVGRGPRDDTDDDDIEDAEIVEDAAAAADESMRTRRPSTDRRAPSKRRRGRATGRRRIRDQRQIAVREARWRRALLPDFRRGRRWRCRRRAGGRAGGRG